jgi:hypothetical protein
MTDTRFRFCALVLLAGILVCQVLQVVRPPPLRSDVWVRGGRMDVNVDNYRLDVEVQNSTLDVAVKNRTLDVAVTNNLPIDVKVQR